MNATRRFCLGGLALSFVGAMSIFAPATARAEQVLNFYIHQSAPQLASSRAAVRLADGITKATNGEIKVRVHLAGTLQINTSMMTDAVSSNVVQMGDDVFYSGNIPVGAVYFLPLLINTYDDYAKVAAKLQPYVDQAYAEKGVVVLGSYAYPMQYIWTRRDLHSLEQFKDIKIRVSSPEQSELIRRLGGSSVTISASEVPSALDRGVVDGVITSSVGADLWKDMLSDGFLLGVNYNVSNILINADVFNSLTPGQQKIVREQAEAAANWATEEMKGEDVAAVDKLSGMAKFHVTRPSPEEVNRARDLIAPYWDAWAKSRGPKVEEALAAARAALAR